jgi:nicotinate-nucleotide adenylyltransferase
LNRLVQFIILERSGAELDYEYPAVRRQIDISASAIRKRVASGLSIRYLVPDAVAEIIHREKLYQGTSASNPKN